MQRSISIVVTCYNYGHFLDACLESLQLQTRRPDEIIVVDDGSLDATQAVLSARKEPLIILSKKNGGQASAFNAGFERATGDIVVFLDADDTLAADAVEILCMAWHDSFVAMSFKLNLVDRAGRFSGFYEVDPRDGDMRPELIGWGHFWFMPTSGNAFSRRLIAPAFPLPEPRWRISADAVLMFAAALAGPIRQLPLALGNYRAHGGNAYYRVALPHPKFMQRAVRDMADACFAVAKLRLEAPILGPDPDIVRLDLLLASLRQRLSPGSDSCNAGTVRPLLRSILALQIGLRAKCVLGFCLALLPPAARLVPPLPSWVVAPDERPRLLHMILSRAMGSRIASRRRSAHRSRWLGCLPKGYLSFRDGHDCLPFFNTLDWRMRRLDRGPVLCGGTGEIVVPVDYFPNGATLSLDLKALEPYARMPLEVALFKADQMLGRIKIHGQGRLSVVLEPNVTLLENPLQLRLSTLPLPATLVQRWATLAGPAGLVEVTGLEVEALPPERSGFLLGLGEHRSFAEIANACQISPPLDPHDPDTVEASDLVILLVRPNVPEATELVLRFGEDQMNGTLVVADNTGPLCRGFIGRAAIVRVPIGCRRYPSDRDLTLTLSLDPDDPFAAAKFRLSSIGFVGRGSTFGTPSPEEFPLIAAGAIWRLDEEVGVRSGFLGDGWMPGELGAELFDTLGMLRLTVDPAASNDAALHMSVAPALPLPEGALLAVAITAGEEALSQVLLQGEHDLAVPLGEALAQGGRRVELAVHVALSDGKGADPQLYRGGLLLKSVRLSAPVSGLPVRRAPLRHDGHTLSSEVEAAGAVAARARGNEASPATEELADLVCRHGRIVAAIRSLASGAVLSVLLNEETLGYLCDLGEAVGGPDGTCDLLQSGRDCEGLFSSDPAEAVRAFALAILTVPPWRALGFRAIGELSDVLRVFPTHLARYLCSISRAIESADDSAACSDHTMALLTYARARLATEPQGSRHERLAEEILRKIRFLPLLSDSGLPRDIARAFGATIETYQLMRGRRITLASPLAEPIGRQRLGVLVRDLRAVQETGLVAATIRALPRDAFDVTVFSLQGCSQTRAKLPRHATIVDLQGVGVDRAVEIVRAAQLDIVLLGASFSHYDEAAAIVAHRLAPVQAAAAAVSPLATGFRSFDLVVTLPKEPRAAKRSNLSGEASADAAAACRSPPLDEKALGRHLGKVLAGLGVG